MCKIVVQEVSDVFFEEDPIDDFVQGNINFFYAPAQAVMTTVFQQFQEGTDVQATAALGMTAQSEASASINIPTSEQIFSAVGTVVSSFLSPEIVPPSSVDEIVSLYTSALGSLMEDGSVPSTTVPSGAGSGTQSQAGSGVPSTASATAAQPYLMNLPPISVLTEILQAVTEAENSAQSQAGNSAQSQAGNSAQSQAGNSAQSQAGNSAQSQAGNSVQSQAGFGVPSTVSVTATQPYLINLPPVSVLNEILQAVAEAENSAQSQAGHSVQSQAGHSVQSQAGHSVQSQAGNSTQSQAGNSAQSQANVNVQSVINTGAQILENSNGFLSPFPVDPLPVLSSSTVPLQQNVSAESQAGNGFQVGPGVQTTANSAPAQLLASTDAFLSQFPFDLLAVPFQAGVSTLQTGNSVQPQAGSGVQPAVDILSQLLTSSSGLSSQFPFQFLPAMASQSQAETEAPLVTAASQLLLQLPLTQPPGTTVHQSHVGTSMQSQAEPAAPLPGFPDSSATSVQSQGSNSAQLPYLLPAVHAATVPQTEISSGAQQTPSIENLVPQLLSSMSSAAQLEAVSSAMSQESPEGFPTNSGLLTQLAAELPAAVQGLVADYINLLNGAMHQFHEEM